MTRAWRLGAAAVALLALASCSSSTKPPLDIGDASTAPLARPATSTSTTEVAALSLTATTGTAGSFTVSPATGAGGEAVTAAGDGCVRKGSGVGMKVALTYVDPTGVAYAGGKGTVTADGTWTATGNGGRAGAPGRYRIRAQCLAPDDSVLFDYPDAYYDATG